MLNSTHHSGMREVARGGDELHLRPWRGPYFPNPEVLCIFIFELSTAASPNSRGGELIHSPGPGLRRSEFLTPDVPAPTGTVPHQFPRDDAGCRVVSQTNLDLPDFYINPPLPSRHPPGFLPPGNPLKPADGFHNHAPFPARTYYYCLGALLNCGDVYLLHGKNRRALL
jgi:hypothetical protein